MYLPALKEHARFHVPDPSERLADIIKFKMKEAARKQPLVPAGEGK